MVAFEKDQRIRSFDDVLVDQLREAILSGRIRPGERLPGERQLCEAFGVGRPTLREALRSLEAVGMIEVRPGKGGGSYAVTPSESTLGDALAALVSLRGASLEDLAEFRVDFEGENAAWAARRADAGDIASWRRSSPRPAARRGTPSGSWGSTCAGTRRSRGRRRTACGSASRSASTGRCCAGTARPRTASTSTSGTIPDEIAAVTRAVASGEPEQARQAMRAHIETWNLRGVAS